MGRPDSAATWTWTAAVSQQESSGAAPPPVTAAATITHQLRPQITHTDDGWRSQGSHCHRRPRRAAPSGTGRRGGGVFARCRRARGRRASRAEHGSVQSPPAPPQAAAGIEHQSSVKFVIRRRRRRRSCGRRVNMATTEEHSPTRWRPRGAASAHCGAAAANCAIKAA